MSNDHFGSRPQQEALSFDRVKFSRRCAILGMLALGGCTPTVKRRFRLSVEISDGGVVRRASAIREAIHRDRIAGLDAMSNTIDHCAGSAIIVDFGRRGALIVTMMGRDRSPSGRFGGNGDLWTPGFATGSIEGHSDTQDVSRDALKALGRRGRVDIAPDALPMMLKLKALDDPSDVRLVDPADLAASFGAGVRLVAAYVEPSRDPLDTGAVLTALPWAEAQIAEHKSFARTGLGTPVEGENIARATDTRSALIGWK